jgi:single-stranded-DNA-specific exonuclease
MNTKRWNVRRHDPEHAAALARVLGISPIVAALLISRGCADESAARAFLNPSYDQLHDSYLMLGMREAVQRLNRAIDLHEPVLIYGDYDVDGTTGTAVLLRALKLLGANATFHVPHRFTEGYGIQREALQRAVANGCRLAVSVDCGIRAHEPLYWARDNGLDVIVTDHHLPDKNEGVPPAFAVLNPNQKGCPYPDKNLAGVGVAFKLVAALFRERGRESHISAFLKVVAIGTVADVARLTGENRTIVSLGLRDLIRARNPGLKALLQIAGCADGAGMTASDLAFRIGPRINAAGRMDAARAVVELFDTKDCEEALRLAQHLDLRNQERRLVQQQIFELALNEFQKDNAFGHVAVVAGEGWHRGVIGIAASKIAERINRPCVVLSIDGEVAHGSGRSIEPYHLLNGLTSCADLFEKFGGHSHAAGLTIKADRIGELRERLNQHAASCLTEDDLTPCVQIDAELALDEVNFRLTKDLSALEPFGAGNPRPVFVSRNLRIMSEPRVMKERHLKMVLAGERGRPLEAVWWNCLDRLERTPSKNERIEVAYTVESSLWNGLIRIQLNVEDVISH